ncbi:P-loop-containing protein [Kribbella sp. WER1]
MRLIYLVGPPGSGKSTLMGALIPSNWLRVFRDDQRMPRTELFHADQLVGAELGRHRESFSGTDALAMNIHPVACRWIAAAHHPVVFGEGQRLGTRGFVTSALEAGRTVDLVWLDPPEEVCRSRREARGSRQSPQWVRAATTRAARLAETVSELPGVRLHRINDHGSTQDIAQRLRVALELP